MWSPSIMPFRTAHLQHCKGQLGLCCCLRPVQIIIGIHAKTLALRLSSSYLPLCLILPLCGHLGLVLQERRRSTRMSTLV